MTRGRHRVIDYSVGIADEILTLTVRRATGRAVNFWSYVDMVTPAAKVMALVSTLVSVVTLWVVQHFSPEAQSNSKLDLVESIGVMLTLLIQRSPAGEVATGHRSARLFYLVAGM